MGSLLAAIQIGLYFFFCLFLIFTDKIINCTINLPSPAIYKFNKIEEPGSDFRRTKISKVVSRLFVIEGKS